jgi:hypothetical protein
MLICIVAAMVILSASSKAMTEEKNKKRAKNRNADRAVKKLSEEQKQWREKLKEMTPEQRRVALAQKNFDAELAQWRQIRKIAAGENAAKTIAAIDKIIADKQTQFKKKMTMTKEKKTDKGDNVKSEGSRREGRKGNRKKAVNEE